MATASFRDRSYWLTTRPYEPGPALAGDLDVDVAIVGAGFTGLSTAHFLKTDDPTLRVALLESEVVGFGASGRNGGPTPPPRSPRATGCSAAVEAADGPDRRPWWVRRSWRLRERRAGRAA